MTTEVEALANIVLSASRKGFFRTKPMFNGHKTVSPTELIEVEKRIGTPIPDELRNWLLAVGYGDIADELSFREEWFAAIESGQLKGGVRFAQDVLGNFYAFDRSGCIHYLSRSESVFAPIATSFLEFVEKLVQRDYKVVDWVSSLEPQEYKW